MKLNLQYLICNVLRIIELWRKMLLRLLMILLITRHISGLVPEIVLIIHFINETTNGNVELLIKCELRFLYLLTVYLDDAKTINKFKELRINNYDSKSFLNSTVGQLKN